MSNVDLETLRPHPLLETYVQSDFSRNYREMRKHARRPYSLLRVIQGLASKPSKLDGYEMETSQELHALDRSRDMSGILIPSEALAVWRRDLSTGMTGAPIQTTVQPAVLPFLRAKTVCGRLGATLLDNLTSTGNLGNLQLPRTTVGGVASWAAETGVGTDADQTLDKAMTLAPKRITASTVVSRQLILQSSVDIENYIANDLSSAIGVAIDSVAINGTGTAPQPLGLLHYPSNTAGAYLYDHLSAPVTFAGAASWPKILAFELALEQGLIQDDGSFGWAVSPTVRDRWQQIAKVTGYPTFLWENSDEDDLEPGRVNGRRSISSTQLPAGQVIFGKWSELVIANWTGLEIMVDPFSLATTSEVRIRVTALIDIGLKHALSFCASADSGAQ
jgi:HK97 family phage major capsid protein